MSFHHMSKKGNIVIIGFGWVGQANALALLQMGYSVFYYDSARPILRYEKEWKRYYPLVPALPHPLAKDNAATSYLITVGDRVDAHGVQDISRIREARDTLRGAAGTVILRSTVLPEHLSELRFDYYLPEFLHEKHAVEECLNPFYFVIGHAETARQEPEFLREWEKRAHKTFRGTAREASYIKYLSNIWNALRISFTNEMGDILSRGGRDRAQAARVLDFLFEEKSYLRYGRAYGGSCLPKDTLAFGRSHRENAVLLSAIHDANERHKRLGYYASLPEWFSRWEFDGGFSGRLARVWRTLNTFPLIRSARGTLRPVRRLVGRFAPKRSPDATKRLWNRLARRHSLFFSHPAAQSGRRVNEYEFRTSGLLEFERLIAADAMLGERLGDFKTRVALDLGTGAGRHLEFFARNFREAVGVDISEEMLQEAKRRLSSFQNIAFIPTTGRHLPVPDASVDFIFSRGTFQSIADERVVASYLSEISRALRSGGVAKLELRAERAAYPWRYTYGLSFTPEEARTLFAGAGLQVLSVTPDTAKYLWVTAEKPPLML